MRIREIELNNFRIYRGPNIIDLATSEGKNIVVVSGSNGFGKTTFLMALVWCLYGRQMDAVDEIYRKEIKEKGGYSKYIEGSLNNKAKEEGETRFCVAVTFSDVNLLDDIGHEVKIVRAYDTRAKRDDDLNIFVDGKASELFSGQQDERSKSLEMFIRDNILPLEIAKFFFFDAEKIVAFADYDDSMRRKELSEAYAQVLGINRYNTLYRELDSLESDYAKQSASREEQNEFNFLETKIKNSEDEARDMKDKCAELQEELDLRNKEIKDDESKLIREGQTMSDEEIDNLRSRLNEMNEGKNRVREELNRLNANIPFALAGELMGELSAQLDREHQKDEARRQNEDAERTAEEIVNELDDTAKTFPYAIEFKVKEFYYNAVRRLIVKHFGGAEDTPSQSNFAPLHNMTELQTKQFRKLFDDVKVTCRSFELLYDKHERLAYEINNINRKIREAEQKSESTYAKALREHKEKIESEARKLQEAIDAVHLRQGELAESIKRDSQKRSELKKRISISYENKDRCQALRSVKKRLSEFLSRFKETKKRSLEAKMLAKTTALMHKRNLVGSVVVDISEEGVIISLNSPSGQKLDNGVLSMGERQLFATALLGALVEETELEFPVFIDSPLQKLDSEHTHNVLTQFYPTVSKQVVLFPLLTKELTEAEYSQIKDKVQKAYLIDNQGEGSHFKAVGTDSLFDEYRQIITSNPYAAN